MFSFPYSHNYFPKYSPPGNIPSFEDHPPEPLFDLAKTYKEQFGIPSFESHDYEPQVHKVYEPVSVYKKPEPVYEPVYKPTLAYKKPEPTYEPVYKPDLVYKKPEPVYEPVFNPVPVYKKTQTHFKPSPPLHALEPIFKPFTSYKPHVYKTPKYEAPKLVSLKIEPHPYHQIVKPISNPYSHKPKIYQTLGFLSPRPAVLPSVFEPTYKVSKEEVEVNIHDVPKWIKTK